MMKKTMLRAVLLLLFICLCVCFTGCREDTAAPNPDDAQVEQAEQAELSEPSESPVLSEEPAPGESDEPAAPPTRVIVNCSCDLAGKLGGSVHDGARLMTCLQGLLNRRFEETGLLVHQTYDANDTFWLDYMREDGNAFADCEVRQIRTAEEYYDFFLQDIMECGLVVWDPAVPSTANAASTVCGVEGYLPICYSDAPDSLYAVLTGMGVPVKLSLAGMFTGEGMIPGTEEPSTGSVKCDAYLWALVNYMDRCSAELLGYVLDGAGCLPGNPTYDEAEGNDSFWNQIYNHDYFVMKKAFCFDLTSNDECPCDDPDQPKGTDRETLCRILQAAYDCSDGGITTVVGFPPWWMKYTAFLHKSRIGEVALEWQFAQLASAYNCVMEADCAHPCCMTNASLYTWYPLAESYENNEPAEMPVYEERTRYFTIYIGDYDSSAWLKSVIPGFWKDKARGTLPLCWGFNPNLSKRIPMVFDYVYRNKSPNDCFLTGDSGAGYVNPSALYQKDGVRELPDGDGAWIAYNKPLLEQFDMDACGFILNGALPWTDDVYRMYHEIAPAGGFSNSAETLVVADGTPILAEQDYSDIQSAYFAMRRRIPFSVFRTVRLSPSQVADIAEELENFANSREDGYTYRYVGPYELFDLIRQSGEGRILE